VDFKEGDIISYMEGEERVLGEYYGQIEEGDPLAPFCNMLILKNPEGGLLFKGQDFMKRKARLATNAEKVLLGERGFTEDK